MNILAIGNGFDLAHGLSTKYRYFLEFVRVINQVVNLNNQQDWKEVNWNGLHPEITKFIIYILNICINNEKVIQIPYFEVDSNIIDCEYMLLEMDDIPNEAKIHITQEMLDEYNASLPSKEILEKNKEECRYYELVKASNLLLLKRMDTCYSKSNVMPILLIQE